MVEEKGIFAQEVTLGNTGIKVSQLCFGTEHINQYSPNLGGRILADAQRLYGVNFWDTDMVYGSHPQVAAGLTMVERSKVVVCSKTYAKDAVTAERDLARIFNELRTEYLDICLLHRVSGGQMEAYTGALNVLLKAKKQGLIQSVGVSTHCSDMALQAAEMPEIEVLCVPLNRDGSRIDVGNIQLMLKALKKAHEAGKGTYVIKILGRGDLLYDLQGAIEWVLQFDEYIDVYNIGFFELKELQQDLGIINNYFCRKGGRVKQNG